MAYKMLTLNTPQRVFFYKYMSSENENDFLVILIKTPLRMIMTCMR